MDWTNRNIHPTKAVHLGDEVEVMILEVDEDRRRLSLGMKQCQPNPWEDFANKHSKDEKIQGSIKSITDFGIFIGLDGGIDGLVHLSDISWTESGEEAVKKFKKGDQLDAVVISIDVEKERISLGIKQLTSDPNGSDDKPAEKSKTTKSKAKKEEASENIATTNLGALLKAKLDDKND
jgi:small subunit ribosomal protein S1